MNTTQLLCALEHDSYLKHHTIGVYAINQIPSLKHDILSFVINSAPSSNPGIHWVALCKNMNCIEIFDSYGKHPYTYFSPNLIKQFDSVKYQTNQFQQNHTDYCGFYCLFFVHMKAKGWSMEKICNLFDIKDKLYNDTLVKQFVFSNFSFLNCANCLSAQSCTKLID